MARTILGIDIGLSGAIAVVNDDGEVEAIHDMPCLDGAGPAGRRAICAPLLVSVIFKTHATLAFVERVGARPGEGPSGAFAFGHSAGIVAGILASAGIPAFLITPSAWKRTVGIPPGRDGAKDAARAEAIRRWPSKADLFARKRDDGRAEACLIAVAGLQREGRR